MEIVFKTGNMKKECEDRKKLASQYGDQQAKKIMIRINELYAAQNLNDIWKLPQVKMHALSGKLKGHFALSVKDPYRMIIYPLNGNTADLKTVTKIQINKPCHDYH